MRTLGPFASKQPATTVGWPAWLVGPQTTGHDAKRQKLPFARKRRTGELFDIDAIRVSASDLDRCGATPKLICGNSYLGLSCRRGRSRDDAGGGDLVEGFAKGIRLMPHQVRGVTVDEATRGEPENRWNSS